MTSMVAAFEQLIVFQERSADLLEKYADLSRETATFINSAINTVVLALDATKKCQRPARKVDVMLYMGKEVHGYRRGDWVTYLDPNEASQKVIGMESTLR